MVYLLRISESLIIGPLVFLLLVAGASIFYHFNNNWEPSTCIFFAAQTLLGCNYSGPIEIGVSKFFTLGLYIVGTTLIAGAISVFASNIVKNTQNLHYDQSHRTSSAVKLWQQYQAVVSILIWCCIGVCWGHYHEGFDILDSIYFAVGALSARGDPEPRMTCNSQGCNLGLARATFFTVYTVVGVNLYMSFMSGFAGLLCDRAVRAHEKKILNRPLAQSEFEFCLALKSNKHANQSTSQSANGGAKKTQKYHSAMSTPKHGDGDEVALDLKDFIILELLRLERVDSKFIDEIREVFELIDQDGNGKLEATDLKKHHDRHYSMSSEASSQPRVQRGAPPVTPSSMHTTNDYNRLFVPLLSVSASKGRRSAPRNTGTTQHFDRLVSPRQSPVKSGNLKKNE